MIWYKSNKFKESKTKKWRFNKKSNLDNAIIKDKYFDVCSNLNNNNYQTSGNLIHLEIKINENNQIYSIN